MIPDGLDYQSFYFQRSRVHLLRIDLTKLDVKPVVGGGAFPFKMTRPILRARDEGAVAAGISGFNLQLSHHQGFTDQPLHALVLDGEIWTTGIGAGGYGVLIGENWAHIAQNHIQVHIFRPDHTSFEVDHVNFGHDGVCATTPRGASLYGQGYITWLEPIYELPGKRFRVVTGEGTVALTTPWQPRLFPGDVVNWSQRLSTEVAGVRHIVSGWPGMIKDGVNVTPLLNLDPQAPNGPDNWFVRINPRAAIGVSEDRRTLFLVCVEGRLPNDDRPNALYSRGLRLKAMANMMLHHGVHNAVGMDSGGSVSQWIRSLGLVMPSCYDSEETLEGLRPDHYVMAAYKKEP